MTQTKIDISRLPVRRQLAYYTVRLLVEPENRIALTLNLLTVLGYDANILVADMEISGYDVTAIKEILKYGNVTGDAKVTDSGNTNP